MLKGKKGDKVNAVLSAADLNFHKLMVIVFCLKIIGYIRSNLDNNLNFSTQWVIN